jgi:TetR/AcrR family fatty acid metabolism transcriptional regulator
MAPSNKRQAILDVAVSVMSQKGKDSTISEIAAGAGVADSVLYHYFKNKDDLLFHAAGEYLKSGINELKSHLTGIRDPASRLSKFIWFQLYFHDTNPQYTYFTIFECRSKKNFFQHAAFDYFRQWTRILRAILEDGQQEGLFSPDLNIFLVRDMILGLLDMENIQFFTGQHMEQAQEDLDAILDLLNPILTTITPAIKNKPQRIFSAAERIFSQEGYDKATISEIAQAANVAEGTIYDYFKNKEDLLHSILQFRFRKHMDSLGDLFETKAPHKKLRRFIRYHFSIYINQPSFANILILNGIFNSRFYESTAYSDFVKYLDTIDAILDEGKAEGCIRPTINNRIFKNLLIGVFSHMALRWLFVGHASQLDKTSEINTVVNLLTEMVTAHPSHL